MRSTLKTRAGWSLAFESVFSAFYWCMTYVMQVFWFVTGVTPLMMLYKKTARSSGCAERAGAGRGEGEDGANTVERGSGENIAHTLVYNA